MRPAAGRARPVADGGRHRHPAPRRFDDRDDPAIAAGPMIEASRPSVQPLAPVRGYEIAADLRRLRGRLLRCSATRSWSNQHVVVFDALDRLTRAFMVWHNDPPKLAAIGFTCRRSTPSRSCRSRRSSRSPPPASRCRSASALFAAGSLAFLDRMFAFGDMTRPIRWALLALVAVNPMFVFYATNGSLGHDLHLLRLVRALLLRRLGAQRLGALHRSAPAWRSRWRR